MLATLSADKHLRMLSVLQHPIVGPTHSRAVMLAESRRLDSRCQSLASERSEHACGALIPGRREILVAAAVLGCTCLVPSSTEAALVEEAVAERVFDATAASVVSITNNVRQGAELIEEAAGSGFVWDARGYIVTNYHCIQKPLQDVTGSQFTLVRVGDSQREFRADYVGTDATHDLAVLKINAVSERLQPIPVGQSGNLKVGQSVFAIGNPFGLSKTLTAGVVSGLNRGIPTPGGAIATRTIQTDAAVSSGNSGGALLDSSGRLVGISTATFSSNKSMGRGSGVNFAIAVDVIREIVPNLIVYGTASGKGV